MKTLTLVAVLIFLGVLFPVAPSSAAVAGSASTSFGGQAITPLKLTPPNITPLKLAPSNIKPPNILPAPSKHSGHAHLNHFQASIDAAQQSQQKAWEAKMMDRQRQLDQARIASEASKAANIAPASGDSNTKPAPYKPSIFLTGFVKLVNMFAPDHHNDKAATAP